MAPELAILVNPSALMYHGGKDSDDEFAFTPDSSANNANLHPTAFSLSLLIVISRAPIA